VAAADPRERLIAFNRFGFGARPGDANDANIAGNARDLLRHELATPNIALISLDDPANAELWGTTTAIAESLAANYERKQARPGGDVDFASGAANAAGHDGRRRRGAGNARRLDGGRGAGEGGAGHHDRAADLPE
jgi:uncharacterized protein (DUF1800 family)